MLIINAVTTSFGGYSRVKHSGMMPLISITLAERQCLAKTLGGSLLLWELVYLNAFKLCLQLTHYWRLQSQYAVRLRHPSTR